WKPPPPPRNPPPPPRIPPRCANAGVDKRSRTHTQWSFTTVSPDRSLALKQVTAQASGAYPENSARFSALSLQPGAPAPLDGDLAGGAAAGGTICRRRDPGRSAQCREAYERRRHFGHARSPGRECHLDR